LCIVVPLPPGRCPLAVDDDDDDDDDYDNNNNKQRDIDEGDTSGI
jgi:hypothetical protein